MLHYWVILPKSLKPTELEPVAFPGASLTNIGRYFTTDESPYLEVWAAYERCEWEMNASDWLFKKLALTGETVLHRRLVGESAENGIFADVLTIKTYFILRLNAIHLKRFSKNQRLDFLSMMIP